MPLTDAPRLLSERLILRGPEPRDMEPVIAFLQDETRASGFGHIPERGAAWRWFALNVGHWHIHGYGYFTIETKTGEIAGISGIWNPETWPEPEVGWVVFDGFEGRGIAYAFDQRPPFAQRTAYPARPRGARYGTGDRISAG